MVSESRALGGPLTVMQLRPDPATTGQVANPYISLLVNSLPPNRVRTVFFTWRDLLRGHYEVLHVHWPEQNVRHANPLIRLVKQALFAAALLRIRLRRVAIVRTAHNVAPHEPGTRIERALLSLLDRMTTLWIVMNTTTPTPTPERTVCIPHGHYRDWHREPVPGASIPGRLLAFGMIRAYKGIDELTAAMLAIPSGNLWLHICGRPESAATVDFLSRVAAEDPRITVDLRHVPDDELESQIAVAEAVVLPYRQINNSGVALLALSMNRPIIVRDAPSTRLLAEEFGEEWVVLFKGDLDGPGLLRAMSDLRSRVRSERLDMSSRDWSGLAEALTDAYVRAVELAQVHQRRSLR